MNGRREDHGVFAGALVFCHTGHGHVVAGGRHPELKLALRPYRKTALKPLWQGFPAGDLFPVGYRIDRGEYLEHGAGIMRRFPAWRPGKCGAAGNFDSFRKEPCRSIKIPMAEE